MGEDFQDLVRGKRSGKSIIISLDFDSQRLKVLHSATDRKGGSEEAVFVGQGEKE